MARVTPSTVGRAYPEVEFGGFTRVDGTVAFYSRINAILRQDFTVMDLGCGRGVESPVAYRRDLRMLRGKCARVLGLDVDETGRANPAIDEFRLIENPSRWPVDDASIDLVICDYVMEHVDDPDAFFSECRRIIRPGGSLCIRTPNRLGYVALMARLLPNRIHARVVGSVQTAREAQDVFPTVYRCNTKTALLRALTRHGFAACVIRHESEPAYLSFSRIIYRIGVVAHRWMPDVFKSTLLAFARRRDD